MSINISKACEGTFYPFTEVINLSEGILEGRLAKFLTPCEVQGTFVTEGEYVHIDCKCRYTIQFQCDRCLADVVKDYEIRYAGSYYLEGGVAPEGYYPYQSGVVDITQGVEEEVLLKLPTRVLCKEDCKGICPICGIDLNKGSCNCKVEDLDQGGANNPFAILKDLKNSTGGASNGSTKG